MSRLAKEGVRAILQDPVLRRQLMVRAIYAIQSVEDPTMTRARAEAAYDAIQQEKKRTRR